MATDLGDKWGPTLNAAEGIIAEFDTDGAVFKFLKETGAVKEPLVISFLAKIGEKWFGEAGYVEGKSYSVPQGNKTTAQKMFPDLK